MVNRLGVLASSGLALIAALYAIPATARDTEGTMSISGRFCRDLDAGQSKHLARVCLTSLDIGWRIGSFLGQPVINTAARWQAEAKIHTRDGRVRDLAAVPAPVRDAYQRLVPFNVRIAVIAWGEAATGVARRRLQLPADIRAALVFDPGAWAASGKSQSYNRPGSPNWTTLFKQARGADACAARSNTDLPADDAKALVRTGAVLGEPAICTMDFNGLADLDRALDAEAAAVAAKAPKVDSRVGSALDKALGIAPTATPPGQVQAGVVPNGGAAKPGSGADVLADVMNRKFGGGTAAPPPKDTKKLYPYLEGRPVPTTGTGDPLADAFGKLQSRDKAREKQAKALTGTVIAQMNRVSRKCDCYINGRNCPPALANRSWLRDEQAKRDFNNAHNAARAQCTSWTSLRARNMTEANKADVLPAKKLALIRTVTVEGDKALAAITRVEHQASGAQSAALNREAARRREADERRAAEAMRKREEAEKEEREERRRAQRRRERQREMAESSSGPHVDPGMKAAADAMNQLSRKYGGGSSLPSYSAPSRSRDSGPRRSRSDSYAGSSSKPARAMRTVTIYTTESLSPGKRVNVFEAVSTDNAGTFTYYPAPKSTCIFRFTRISFSVYRHTFRVPTDFNLRSDYPKSVNEAIDKQLIGWRDYYRATSPSEARNFQLRRGCKEPRAAPGNDK